MKEKSDNLIKTPSKIQSFEEVQKALQDLAKQLNDLGIATNSGAEGEITDKDGKTGDIRITQNEDKTYGLELKTEEGWKFPSVGESPVQLTGTKGEKSRPDAVVDKHKDEFGKPTNMPRPDYDSGFFHVALNKFYITGAETGVQGDWLDDIGAPAKESNSIFELDHNIWENTVGIPALGFELNSPPTLVQSILCPPGITTWEEAIATGMILITNGYEGQYHWNWNSSGAKHYIYGKKSYGVAMSGHHIFIQDERAGSVDNFHSGNIKWYQAHDPAGVSETGTYRLRIWK